MFLACGFGGGFTFTQRFDTDDISFISQAAVHSTIAARGERSAAIGISVPSPPISAPWCCRVYSGGAHVREARPRCGVLIIAVLSVRMGRGAGRGSPILSSVGYSGWCPRRTRVATLRSTPLRYTWAPAERFALLVSRLGKAVGGAASLHDALGPIALPRGLGAIAAGMGGSTSRYNATVPKVREVEGAETRSQATLRVQRTGL